MKRKVTIVFTLFFLLLISKKNFAESYTTGIGFRLGGITSGITVKHFLSSSSAIEGIASFGRHAFLITGLYEKHYPFPADGLNWFFGAGLHVGFFQNDYSYKYFYYKYHGKKVYVYEVDDHRSSFGGDFILGLDYKIPKVPIDIAIDAKPFFDFTPGFYGYWEGALTFRFTL